VFTDTDGTVYHYVVEGTSLKDGSKVPPEVCYQYQYIQILYLILRINHALINFILNIISEL